MFRATENITIPTQSIPTPSIAPITSITTGQEQAPQGPNEYQLQPDEIKIMTNLIGKMKVTSYRPDDLEQVSLHRITRDNSHKYNANALKTDELEAVSRFLKLVKSVYATNMENGVFRIVNEVREKWTVPDDDIVLFEDNDDDDFEWQPIVKKRRADVGIPLAPNEVFVNETTRIKLIPGFYQDEKLDSAVVSKLRPDRNKYTSSNFLRVEDLGDIWRTIKRIYDFQLVPYKNPYDLVKKINDTLLF